MLFYSTNHKSPKVSFKTATIQGLATDGGLYYPETIPVLDDEVIKNLQSLSIEEIGLQVIQPYVGKDIPLAILKKILNETMNFNIPLIKLDEQISSLELFHGPTLAFKDVGARFMSRCLGYFIKEMNKNITVLVATSGDTGGAVADGFFDIEGIDVVILYPAGRVSPIQELQLTTHGKNIHAIEVQGSFDDCQQLVKEAFQDKQLNDELFLTSANSINVARWLPQQLYYFMAYQQWDPKNGKPVVSVPSGNFGNICAGLLAKKSGLPFEHFIAACNANDIVPKYFETGEYHAAKAITTISNAMDVGNPSNFIRILELFKDDEKGLKELVTAYSFTDAENREGIKKLHSQFNYVSDPHGAIGFLGLKKYLDQHKDKKGFFLETAHPIKFPEIVEETIDSKIPMPDSISNLSNKKSFKISMPYKYEDLKNYLISKN